MGCNCNRKKEAATEAAVQPSTPTKPRLSSDDLRNYFDWVVVLNVVDKRPDRIITLNKQLDDIGWCFKRPEVFPAIDGDKCGVPTDWKVGGGAWGCMQSHRQILERAIMNNRQRVLILEDDADFAPDFVERVTDFLSNVPSDWDCLMLGGQHIGTQAEHLRTAADGVVRCQNTQRTHAYAVQGAFIKGLYQKWISTHSAHCDWELGPYAGKHKTYAPKEFIVCQREGKSDINGAVNPRKCWNPTKEDQPTIFLKCSDREAVAELRRHGLHTGYSRDGATDLDLGLNAIFDTPDLTEKEVAKRVKKWVADIQWECAQADGLICTVWHPKVKAEHLRGLPKVVEIEAATAAEALEKLPADIKTRKVVAPALVVLLTGATKDTVDNLRKHGFHFGYWRNEGTGIDNGLEEAFSIADAGKRNVKLRECIGKYLVREAETISNGVAVVWHPKATREEVEAATALKVVEIATDDVREALEQLQAARGK